MADGDAEDWLQPDEVDGLPKVFWPRPGSDKYTDEVFDRVLRRDVAAYLLRVRHKAPRVADELSMVLPLVPVGWCSVVAPRSTWEEFQRSAREDVQSAVLLADLLGVRYEPLLAPAQARLMRFAVQQAASWFCPDHDLDLRESVPDADVDEAAEFPTREHYSLQELQREGYSLDGGYLRADSATQFEVELAFQSALVGIAEVTTEFGCDMAAYFSRNDHGVRDTARNILALKPSVDARLTDVWKHQTLTYLVAQERRACRAGRL